MYRSLALLVCSQLLGAISATQHIHRSPSGTSTVDVSPRGANTTDDTQEVVASAWYPDWSGVPPENLSWWKYTHMVYAFGLTTPDPSNIVVDDTRLREFVAQAKSNGVSPILAIGGWGGSQHFSTAVEPENSTSFVNAVLGLVINYGLDGIDFDWEYPGEQGIGCNVVAGDDSANFLAFLQELKQESPTLVLTAAVGTTPFIGADQQPMINVSAFAQVLDRIELMVYDTWWSNTTAGPNAPLIDTCVESQYQRVSVESAVEAWIAAQFPAEQIVLGLAAYGHSFNVTPTAAISNSVLNLYPALEGAQPVGASDDLSDTTDACGNPPVVSGVFTFAQLVSKGFIDANGTAQHNYLFDECTRTPYVYDEEKHVLVSYDDAQSFAAKGEFILDNGLAGFAMWEVVGDYNDILVDSLYATLGIEDCIYGVSSVKESCIDSRSRALTKPRSPTTGQSGPAVRCRHYRRDRQACMRPRQRS
ncbi:glycoside hydrolase family 18 protein [Mycena sp. CBHHK59/15]|nr:glycoside hydrolase family 18 protein [Mycena sp. CBHHK59/15]